MSLPGFSAAGAAPESPPFAATGAAAWGAGACIIIGAIIWPAAAGGGPRRIFRRTPAPRSSSSSVTSESLRTARISLISFAFNPLSSSRAIVGADPTRNSLADGNALGVLAGARVDLEDVPDVDEEGDLDLRAGLQLRLFVGARRRIALEAGLRVLHRELHEDRE